MNTDHLRGPHSPGGEPADDRLHEELHAAADGLEFAVPDLRPRARAARRRRRVLGTAAVAATVALGAGLALQLSLGGSSAVPADDPSPTPSPTASPTAPPTRTDSPVPPTVDARPAIPHDAIVEGCLPQLTASEEIFGPIPDDLRVARDRDYRAGDIVRLTSDSGWDPTVLCIATDPASYVHRDVRDTLREVTSDVAPEVCSELMSRETPEGPSFDTVDLRGSEVVGLLGQSDDDTSLWHIILEQGDHWYSCGWSFRPNGTIDDFGDDEPVGPLVQDVPGGSTAIAWAHWDGVSPTALAVVWGEYVGYEEKATDLRAEGTSGYVARLAVEPDKLFQTILHIPATGTADDWSTDWITISVLGEEDNPIYTSRFRFPSSAEATDGE